MGDAADDAINAGQRAEFRDLTRDAQFSRTQKRSRSGADHECPHCRKRLRGAKGLKAHVRDMHGEAS